MGTPTYSQGWRLREPLGPVCISVGDQSWGRSPRAVDLMLSLVEELSSELDQRTPGGVCGSTASCLLRAALCSGGGAQRASGHLASHQNHHVQEGRAQAAGPAGVQRGPDARTYPVSHVQFAGSIKAFSRQEANECREENLTERRTGLSPGQGWVAEAGMPWAGSCLAPPTPFHKPQRGYR